MRAVRIRYWLVFDVGYVFFVLWLAVTELALNVCFMYVCVIGNLWQHFRGALVYDPARNFVWDQCVTSSQVTEDLQSDQVSLSCLESCVCRSVSLFSPLHCFKKD